MQKTDNNAQELASPQQPGRIITIDGALNFRDLGGYRGDNGRRVKWGKVYRSAALDRLSETGVQALAALGIQTVVDLRFSDESSRYPTIRSAVPQAEMLSWHEEQLSEATAADTSAEHSQSMVRSWRDSLDSGDAVQVREAMRINYPVKLYSHRKIYQRMVQRLCSDQAPLVFHCAAGKDRTGVAAALILALLGVDEEQIIADYLLTESQLAGHMENWLAGGATDSDEYDDFQNRLARQPRHLLTPIFAADQAYIETLLEYIAKTYGGFEHYALTRLELSETELDALRQNLLDD